MKKIKGRVQQIIKPEEQDLYLTPDMCPFLHGNYHVVIEREDMPEKGFFKRLVFIIKHKREERHWIVSFNNINFKLGDIIQIDCEPYYQKTSVFIPSQNEIHN